MYKPVLGNGLVTSEGDFWLRQRKLSQPAFLKNRVLSYAPMMGELTRQMLARWRPGQDVNIHFEFSGLTSAIALKTLFGLDDHEDRESFVQALRQAFLLLSEKFRSLVRVPLWVPTPRNLRLKRAIAHLNRVVDGFIASGRSRTEPGNDLLSRLIHAQDDEGAKMTDRQLRDEAMTLYLAGHETTALTLTWSWVLLAQHPHVEEKLAAEWQRVLGGRTPTPEDLPNLPYTDAVMHGSDARLSAGVPDRPRGDVRSGTRRLPRAAGQHRLHEPVGEPPRPALLPGPGGVPPERWEDGLAKRLPKYAYYPFGGGPRVCIGNTFALMEAAILLATVGQQYRFTIAEDAVIDVNPQITLLPMFGIPARLEMR